MATQSKYPPLLISTSTINLASNVVGGGAGQVVYQSGASTTGFITPAVGGTVLTSNGVASQPTFQAIGTPAAATNLAGGSIGLVPYQTGVSTTGFITPAAGGTVLTSNGAASQPTFQAIGTPATATNLAGGSIGLVPYQTGVSTTGFISPGTAGRVLTSTGAATQPTFQTPATPSTATNLAGGSAGLIASQTASSTTGFITPGVAGTVLTSNGVSSQATFQTPAKPTVSTLLVGTSSPYTTPSTSKYIQVECLAGGGAGGGFNGTNTSYSGGGAGGYGLGYFAGGGASYTFSVGSGGTGVSGTGGAGGSTTWSSGGTQMIATGGDGGESVLTSSTTLNGAYGGQAFGAGVSIIIPGNNGFISNVASTISAQGGTGFFGSAGRNRVVPTVSTAGESGFYYGGGGATCTRAGGGTPVGGNGAPGVIYVTVYY